MARYTFIEDQFAHNLHILRKKKSKKKIIPCSQTFRLLQDKWAYLLIAWWREAVDIKLEEEERKSYLTHNKKETSKLEYNPRDE